MRNHVLRLAAEDARIVSGAEIILRESADAADLAAAVEPQLRALISS